MLLRRTFLVGLFCSVLCAGSLRAQPGGDLTSFGFLRLEPSARAAALSGAFAAVADGDVNGLFYNPALLTPRTHRVVSASYLNHLTDINAGILAYGHRVRGLGTSLGAGLRFVSWGEIEGRNENGEPTGTFGAGDVALTLGAARGYGTRWRYGVSTTVVYASIETARASALMADVGVLYQLPAQQLAVGVSVRRLGVVLDAFGRRGESLPLDVQLSASKQLAHLPLRVAVTGYDLTNVQDGVEGGTTLDHILAHLTFGGEFRLGEVLRLRLGYNHRRSKELALNDRLDLAGLGAGFGLRVRRLHVDYAYNSWSSYGGLHQFTLRTGV